jgi:adenine-specific DNA-methyltransferase
VELLDFGDLPVFPEATTYPNILSVRRAPATFTVRVAELTALSTDPTRFLEMMDTATTDMPIVRLSEEAWSLAAAAQQELLEKLRKAGRPLGVTLSTPIFRGIQTGYNEAFILDENTRKRLINEDSSSSDFIKPFFVGKDVKRYKQPKSDKYLLYIPWNFNIEKQKAIGRYLEEHKQGLSARPEVMQGNFPWFALTRPKEEQIGEYNKPKIVFQEIATYHAFAYDNEGLVSNNKTFLITDSSLFLLGILNSAPVWFFINQVAAKMANGAIAMQTPYINQIPIPTSTSEQQAAIAVLVEQTLATKSADATADTSALEAAIDVLVYRLYRLEYAEVLLVDAAFGLSEAEYGANKSLL